MITITDQAVEKIKGITSVPEVNDLIAEKLFMLDKEKKLYYIKLIKRPHSVINQYA